MKIPFVDLRAQYLNHRQEIDQAIASVLESTSFIGGPIVKSFEQEFATLIGAKHCISCGNGTDSLFIIMKMLDIGPGDEVVTVANSWISSSETISLTGATPVFVDVDPQYMSFDPDDFEKKLTPRTKALVLVHLHGQMCNLDRILKICQDHGIYLIEDCAQAHLSRYGEKNAGVFGLASSFSFYPGKNLGAYGDAGCIVTNDDQLATRCQMFARHGALVKHEHQMEGLNSRLDTLQAAILRAKLPRLESWTIDRGERAELYRQALGGIEEIILPTVRPGTRHSYHLYVVRCQRRDELKTFLSQAGIETALHYPTPLPLLPAYARLKHQPTDFPVAHSLSQEILSLPLYPELKEDQIGYVAQTIKHFYAGAEATR